MRTLSESLARLAELLPKIDIECQAFERFEFVRLLVFAQKPHSILIESFEIDASSNVESHQNAGALERLSDLVYERAGWYALAMPVRSVSGVAFTGCADHVARGGNAGLTPHFSRFDHAHVEALILAIEKHLEEK